MPWLSGAVSWGRSYSCPGSGFFAVRLTHQPSWPLLDLLIGSFILWAEEESGWITLVWIPVGPSRNYQAVCLTFWVSSGWMPGWDRWRCWWVGRAWRVCCGRVWLSRALLRACLTLLTGSCHFAQRVACLLPCSFLTLLGVSLMVFFFCFLAVKLCFVFQSSS